MKLAIALAAGIAAASPLGGCQKAPARTPAPVAPAPTPTTPNPSPAGDPSGAAGAEAFLKSVYAQYYAPATRRDDLDSLGAQRGLVYDKAMLALMAEDERLTPKGEVGALDWDPLCQCQDEAQTETVMTASGDGLHASAPVRIDTLPAAPFVHHGVITIDLIYEDGHWRIHDVTAGKTTMRKIFEDSNRRARAQQTGGKS